VDNLEGGGPGVSWVGLWTCTTGRLMRGSGKWCRSARCGQTKWLSRIAVGGSGGGQGAKANDRDGEKGDQL